MSKQKQPPERKRQPPKKSKYPSVEAWLLHLETKTQKKFSEHHRRRLICAVESYLSHPNLRKLDEA